MEEHFGLFSRRGPK